MTPSKKRPAAMSATEFMAQLQKDHEYQRKKEETDAFLRWLEMAAQRA